VLFEVTRTSTKRLAITTKLTDTPGAYISPAPLI
jgi:hypothetical protein